MSAKSEIIIKNITQAAQILGLATNINIIPKTATKMVYNSNKTRDNLLCCKPRDFGNLIFI